MDAVDVAEKPPYELTPLAKLRARRPNGLSVCSTFTGAGGSCLGFLTVGFRTRVAVEFVEAARETYALNFPDVPIEARDVREVSGDDLRAAADVDEFDVLEGSPPCSPFSVAGKRDRDWGKIKSYSATKQRSDDLFDEYVRLLRELRPRAFVAENVKGFVTGKAKGYYLRLMGALRESGYVVAARLLDAQWLGVPQRRERVIIVGVRDDLGREPMFPSPLAFRYSLGDVLPGLRASTRDGVRPTREPIPTVQTHGNRFTRSELVAIPYAERDSSDGIAQYAVGREWATLRQGEGSEKYLNLIRASIDEPSPSITAAGGPPGTASVVHPTEPRKFTIEELKLLCGFPADFVLTGTYAQQWERLGRAVPPPMMAAVARCVADVLGSV